MLNIRNVRRFGLAQSVQADDLGGFDLMVLTKTKISTMAYCWNQLGCNIVCSTARPASAAGLQGGVGLVLRDLPTVWSLELMHFHGPNMVI